MRQDILHSGRMKPRHQGKLESEQAKKKPAVDPKINVRAGSCEMVSPYR